MPERLGHIMAMPGETAPRPDEVRSLVNCLHKVYDDPGGTWFDTCLLGSPGWKYPPDFIVETGSAWRVLAGFAV
jgi:hypothetical protein